MAIVWIAAVQLTTTVSGSTRGLAGPRDRQEPLAVLGNGVGPVGIQARHEGGNEGIGPDGVEERRGTPISSRSVPSTDATIGVVSGPR